MKAYLYQHALPLLDPQEVKDFEESADIYKVGAEQTELFGFIVAALQGDMEAAKKIFSEREITGLRRAKDDLEQRLSSLDDGDPRKTEYLAARDFIVGEDISNPTTQVATRFVNTFADPAKSFAEELKHRQGGKILAPGF